MKSLKLIRFTRTLLPKISNKDNRGSFSDKASGKEDSETRQASWGRFMTMESLKRGLLQPLELPSDCVCIVLQVYTFWDLSIMLEWSLMTQLSLSHFCN